MICFPLDNTLYEANALGAWFCTRTRGVLSSDDHYFVSANGGMGVMVSPGIAWLRRDDYWGTVLYEASDTALPIAIPDPTLNRYDAICLQLDKNSNSASLVVKQGAYDITPAIPPIARDLNYDEIYLATVYVVAGATEITAADITDQRLNEELCGIMRDGVTGIPTAQLQAQADALIQLIADQLARVNAGTEWMLKTEYAPDATATIAGGVLAVTSLFPHPQTEYDVRFTMPAGAFTSVSIDGVAMTGVFDTTGDEADFEPAPGVPVTLTRQGERAFFKQGGGLNYRVLAVASESALPATARNNALAVVTTNAIAGYLFSATPPDSPNTGVVWIACHQSSLVEFTTTRKDGALLQPIGCYQYTGSSWAPRPFHIFQNGAWEKYPETILLAVGFQPVDMQLPTGQSALVFNSGYCWTVNAVDSAASRIHSMVVSREKIDITEQNTIRLLLYTSYSGGASTGARPYIGLHSSQTVSSNSNTTPQNLFAPNSFIYGDAVPAMGDITELTLDVSEYSGEAYIAAGWQKRNVAGTQSGAINRLWME